MSAMSELDIERQERETPETLVPPELRGSGLAARIERMTRDEFWRFALTCLAVFWTCVVGAVLIPLLVG